MPYVTYPRWARRVERAALVARYLPILGLAIVSLLLHASLVPVWISSMLVLSALSCILGVLSTRYHVEWVGMSVLALSMLLAVNVIDEHATRLAVWLAIALTLSLGDRWVRLARESWLARQELRREKGALR